MPPVLLAGMADQLGTFQIVIGFTDDLSGYGCLSDRRPRYSCTANTSL